MSGRSAYVRKEKTKTKDGEAVTVDKPIGHSPSILEEFGEFPVSNAQLMQFEHRLPIRQQGDLTTIKSGSSNSDDLAYARVRKPHIPVIIDSGIEKSSLRSLMDKKSEEVRKGLVKTFGGKKKKLDEDSRPPTSATVRPDHFSPPPPPSVSKSKIQTFNSLPPYQQNQTPEYIRPGPPSSKLPPIPQGPQLKRWIGGGRPAKPWNKLHKDPELWDPNGDTLIFFGHETHHGPRPPPSFRLSSRILEATESRFLITLLRESSIEEVNAFGMAPSPVSSSGIRPALMVGSGRHQPTPPVSETSTSAYKEQISYEIYFPVPLNQSKNDTLRHQLTTRNVFALLYQASLVGINLFQTLNDLQERLENYMPADCDAAGLIIDYIVSQEIDDVRESPSVAAAILAWSETQAVRWEEGWREAYVHSAGMYNRLKATSDFRFITPITRALLERANLEVQVRVQSCEDSLSDFDFEDMWSMIGSQNPPARASFERLRTFFTQYYLDASGSWPPEPPAGEEQWLTRSLAQKMQKDFGALYDYLVNREVTWDCSEERSGRKWNIIHAGNRSFEAESSDIPFTDLLVAFDNRRRYPHIPHPYPLVPDSTPVKILKDNLLKSAKKTPKTNDKIAGRRAALAYTESSNIYLLGSDFVNNDLVDAFVRFEKADKATEIDPYAARRGRWILIYGILQTLASISVDTPDLRYTGDVSYYLNPRLRGTPPWKGANQNFEEASHVGSYCWTIRDTWRVNAPVTSSRRRDNPISSTISQAMYVVSTATSYNDGDNGPMKTPFSRTSSESRSTRKNYYLTSNSDNSADEYFGYGPGTEKVNKWPVREGSRSVNRGQKKFFGSTRQSSQKDFRRKEYSQKEAIQKGLTSDFAIKDFDGDNF